MQLDNFSKYEIYPEEGKVWSYISDRFIGRKHPKKGYWFVALTGDDGKVWNTSLHRISWIAVNGEIPEGYEVNHINENKDDNGISNLNLKTPRENSNWGTKSERISAQNSKPIVGIKNGKPSILFSSITDARCNGYVDIYKHLKNQKKYKGYNWFYVKDYLNIT